MESTSLISNLWTRYKRINAWTAMASYVATLVLFGLAFLPPFGERLQITLLVVAAGLAADYGLHKLQETGRSGFPRSGLITSLIVTLLMPPEVPLLQALLAVLLAIGSKHFLLKGRRHIFNPASFGVAVTAALFGFGLGWWPDNYTAFNGYLILAVGLGLVNVYRVRKYPQLLAFAAVYFLLVFIGTDFKLPALSVQSLASAWPWFFTFYMLPEPLTSPGQKQQQLIFGALAALVTAGALQVELLSRAAPLWGLLAANAYAAVKRP